MGSQLCTSKFASLQGMVLRCESQHCTCSLTGLCTGTPVCAIFAVTTACRLACVHGHAIWPILLRSHVVVDCKSQRRTCSSRVWLPAYHSVSFWQSHWFLDRHAY